jgi:hypothetical protein
MGFTGVPDRVNGHRKRYMPAVGQAQVRPVPKSGALSVIFRAEEGGLAGRPDDLQHRPGLQAHPHPTLWGHL